MDYQRIYNQLIEKARSENRAKVKDGIYYERHHIIPKCIGGEGKTYQWKTHPNIILLTSREHFVAHQLLCLIYPNEPSLKFALWAMCNQKLSGRIYRVSSRVYEVARLGYISIVEGVTKSPQHRQALSLAKKGIPRGPMTDEHLANLKKAITGLSKSDSHKKNLSIALSVPRYQYTLEGQFVQVWESTIAAGKALGIDPGDIASCCIGRKKTAGGFIWSTKEETINPDNYRHSNARKIFQLDMQLNFINKFNSINQAAKAVGILPGSISQNINKRSKNAGGFVWLYEEDFLSLCNRKIN
jgi:hypothetical protein